MTAAAIRIGITLAALIGWLALFAMIHPAHAESALASDSFNRATALGWGRDDQGAAWITVDDRGAPLVGVASVAPGSATLRTPSVPANRMGTALALVSPTVADSDQVATVTPSRPNMVVGLVARGSRAGSYQAVVVTSSPLVAILKNGGLDGSWFVSLPQNECTTSCSLHFRVQGGDLALTVWDAGAPEPATPTVVGLDLTPLPAGLGGIMAQVDAGDGGGALSASAYSAVAR